ncbi:HAD-IIIC family phosphatase [Geomonas paludis]|uniref:Methoxymalonyl-ACP biosynthesis protein FkbH n=1 Tax=Geomonas paludis TaxID=2740185 RepID=A0A6V8MW65_9BACT|nr:HAD-IIIC family phosphatase [Geomonas paludis]GFO63833.1 methoxymalonyl-ACP biosynthesis protein FkbH [Geomonas paludis]
MAEPTHMLMMAKEHCKAGEHARALEVLRSLASRHDPLPMQAQYARLALTIAQGLEGLPVLRVAFLAGSTLDHLVGALRFWLLLEGFRLEPYLAPFDTWRQEAADPSSGLYSFRPDLVWFFLTARDLKLEALWGDQPQQWQEAAAGRAAEVATLARQVLATLPATVLVNNAEASATRVLGNFEGSVSWSAASLQRRYNLELAQALPAGASVFDLEHLASCFGLERWEDHRLWCHSKHPFSLEAHAPVAFAGAKLIAAAKGKARKCLVLDLDNTLWGGVVGDDGVDGIRVGPDAGAAGEAYAAFQAFAKSLSLRGIALAVCSKNDPDLAREPFRSRQGMALTLDDFAVFRANWDNKADNLRQIARELNLGLEALVFVDDNPAERALVRAELPQVAVPELSADPADYMRVLAEGAWFETLTFVEEDRSRSRAYRDNAARNACLAQSSDLDGYLRSLEMRACWGDADQARLSRLAQLVNKTNQFHLTTTRYSEPELTALSLADDAWVGWFSLSDRFGDHGVIAAVVLRFRGQAALVDTWTMSCRVFSRGMEDFIFLKIWEVAKGRGCTRLEGAFRPTPKNGVVATLYDRLGGSSVQQDCGQESRWHFDLVAPPPDLTHYIADANGSGN